MSFELYPHTIYGLIGRNGAGKTTLLTALMNQIQADSGSFIELFGESGFSSSVLAKTHLMRTGQTYSDDTRVFHVLRMAEIAYPMWDAELAAEAVELFEIPLKLKARKLSDGQKSALGIAVALASRAELTLMDEPYTGLDPVARQKFYDLVLRDFSENPRTFVISTHLIDEIAPLLNHIILLEKGSILLNVPADDTTAYAHEISGTDDAVAVYLSRNNLERSVASSRSLAGRSTALVAAELTDTCVRCAQSLGVAVSSVSLQNLVAAYSQATERQAQS
ncbi:ABC transporter ATP-binding protein [Rothia amarae]|uniref:ABC transporter ATP-binding protein n=1 Tax=Rothia amarae TaxID=169480 RepID=UPI0033CBB337